MNAALRDTLHDLEKRHKLEKLLAPNQDLGLPWHDMAWLLQFPACIGIAIWVMKMADVATETKASPPPDMLAWLLLLVLVALALRCLGPLLRSKAQKLRDQVRRRGVLVPGAIVMANDAFFAADNDRWLPATLVVCFDPTAPKQLDRLAAVAKRLHALKGADRRTLPPAHADLAWDLYHEMGPLRSRPVPFELSEGLKDCLMVTVMLPPQPLEHASMLVALALPGELAAEAVAVLPASLP